MDFNWRAPHVAILLVCGHTVKARDRPVNKDQRFACTANTGCGYRIKWRSSTERGVTVDNWAVTDAQGGSTA